MIWCSVTKVAAREHSKCRKMPRSSGWGNHARVVRWGNHAPEHCLQTANFLAFPWPPTSLDRIPPCDELGGPYR